MFKKYEDLLTAIPTKGVIRFFERKEIENIKALTFFFGKKEIHLPMINNIIIPRKKARRCPNKGWLNYWILNPEELAIRSKFFKKVSRFCRGIDEAGGKEFYGCALHHGYDYGHHGEASVTGLFIDAELLEANPNKLINPGSRIYSSLLYLENMKAFYTGRKRRNPNPKRKLEEKIRNLTDENLYSWG